jgi:hypothetical protein
MTKSTKVVLAIAVAFLVGIALLFVVGRDGFAAGMLTLPGSLPVSYLLELVPAHAALETIADSWTGNLLELLVSAALNVAGLYVVVRLLSKM